MWTTFLQEELFDYLHLKSPLELAKVISKARKDSDFKLDYRAIQEVSNQDQLLPVLLEYNKQEKERQFERNSYTCKVCFCEKAGMHCICFDDCGHVYCKDCMRDYFNVQIQEGNVKGLECPEDKCESQAHPSQVNINIFSWGQGCCFDALGPWYTAMVRLGQSDNHTFPGQA